MKRRKFFKQVGKGLTSSLIIPGMLNPEGGNDTLEYEYPGVGSFGDLINEEGLVAARILMEGKSGGEGDRLKGKINIRRGKVNRVRDYFSLQDDFIDREKSTFDLTADPEVKHVLACWLENLNDDSIMIIHVDKESHKFPLSEVVRGPEVVRESKNVKITVSGLPYHEIGTVDAGGLGIPTEKNEYRFVIMADPQGGDPSETANASPTRIKIHNAFIEESIELAGKLDPSSIFTLILGDLTDSQGEEKNFNRMIGYYEKLHQPILLEIGNHETKYRSVFTPGYNMSAFDNYFAAQKRVNGIEKLLYSFDVGEWHFIVWPDPLRNNFWETHPHYFDWLELDLAKNRQKPVFFFQHVPMHPAGINPLVSYVNPVHINRLLYEILTVHGNVQYVFSGHVHIPLRASSKTAVNFMGMRMINLPPAGYRPRAFGEEDYYGGPSQGIGIVDVEGERARISFLTVTGRKFQYPDQFREYSSGQDPLWFRYKWELEGNAEVLNGSFENGLEHWQYHYVYPEDSQSS
ncbi:MAG: metallophosphoesterase, partial [Cyclobacteriaceae bacterium]|nr:metallophosphoesterase [Cyclobacteriaceae bacterium]